MIRTLIFALRSDPANSYEATQQNAAYNVAVDIVNPELNLPKRNAHPASGDTDTDNPCFTDAELTAFLLPRPLQRVGRLAAGGMGHGRGH